MTIEVKVPVFAESISEASLLQWHKRVGEPVQRGENLIDIETDKVTLEVAAPSDGVLLEILKQDGEDVASNDLIAIIGTETRSTGETVSTGEQEELASTPDQQAVANEVEELPKLSPAVRHLLAENKLQASDITTLNKSDRITKEDVLNHLKSTTDAEAPSSASTDTPSEEQESVVSADAKSKLTQDTVEDTTTQPQQLGAKTRRRKRVAERLLAAQHESENVESKVMQDPTANPTTRPQERVPMTRLRKRVAERLLAAQHENALLSTFNEVNMQPVIDLRNRHQDEFQKVHDVKLGFMSFFTQATVEALKKFPIINASIEGEDILYRGYFDIGIAVGSPRGLVVPVLRDADMLSLAAIESMIKTFGHKANEGKLTIEELTGGGFTITNGGIFGSLLSTPIVNPPQSAILGMHKIQERPVAENGQIVIRPMMYLALSYDHRIIDGREAVQFLVSVKEQIEDPSRLLLKI